LASYTYGKSMDWASSIQEQVNPFDFRKEYAISAFDLKHNFVFSYNYELPFAKLFRISNRWTQGWAISGRSCRRRASSSMRYDLPTPGA
jgi:hypothetical protein